MHSGCSRNHRVQVLFMLSLFLLQLSALSMIYGHQLGALNRLIVVAVPAAASDSTLGPEPGPWPAPPPRTVN